jgi:hypothetical protein
MLSKRQFSPSRRAAVVLWCAALLSGILVFAALWRSIASSNLRMTSRELAMEWQFHVLARSVSSAIEYQVRQKVNSASPLAQMLRRPLTGPDSKRVDITPYLDMKPANDILEREEFAGFTARSVEAVIAHQEPITGAEEEKVAIVVIKVALRLPGQLKRTRTLEVARAIKVSRAGIDPKLTEFGLFIGDASTLTDTSQVNALRDDLRGRTSKLHKVVTRLHERAPATQRQPYALVLDQLMDPTPPDAYPKKLPETRQYALYGLLTPDATQDLANLDLATALRSDRDKIEQLQGKWDSSIGSHPELMGQAAGSLAQALMDAAFRQWAFQEAFYLLPLEGPESRTVRFLESKLDVKRLERSAQWVLHEDPQGVSIQDQVDAILARPGVTNGVLMVENQKAPLVLRGEIRGTVMIMVGPGGVSLEGVNRSMQNGQQLTVYAHSGPVRLKGMCRAILALGQPGDNEPPLTLEFAQSSHLVGALLVTRLPATSQTQGLLTRGISSPLFPGYDKAAFRSLGLFAAVSPRILYQRVLHE